MRGKPGDMDWIIENIWTIAAAIIGILSLLSAALMGLVAIVKKHWLPVEAVILKTGVKVSHDAERHLVRDYSIDYSYRVNGMPYFGSDAIRVEASYYDEDEKLDQLRKEFEVGSLLEVFYDPRFPQFSSARREVVGLRKAIFCGTVGLFIAIVLYYMDYAMELSRHGHYY